MSEPTDEQLAERLRGRPFTLAEAIAKHAGDGFFHGASPVPAAEAAHLGLQQWLRHHLSADPWGCVVEVLSQDLDPVRLAEHTDDPLVPLIGRLETVLSHEGALHELVRRVDVAWGRATGERPHFQRGGQPPHPQDDYTHASVQRSLQALLEQARSERAT